MAFAFAGAASTQAALAQSSATQEPSTPGPADQQSAANSGGAVTVLKTTVRRVVLDVVVTDSHGAPVAGLTKADFTVTEDGDPQKILSFDANGFSGNMDYVPPPLPPQPPNTFINMPATPEKGPLYVLLYDLTNMDTPDQMDSPEDHHIQLFARQQIMKFIEGKPEGARFAIFVRSDGLHLIQGFTSDKAKLYAALDPHNPKAHIPMVFLMAPNFGMGDHISAMNALHTIATYLDGLPGRKNLIWFASEFPLSLFADETDGPRFQEETKATLELLAQDQIAVYPVYAAGVPKEDSHVQLTTSVHSDTVTSSIEAGSGASTGTGGIGVGNSPASSTSGVQGSSVVNQGYNVMDSIARDTGGRAFYGTNDVSSELVKATQSGGVYYTLTYSPSDKNYDGKLRNIKVELANKGYQLSYRRSYYATDSPVEGTAAAEAAITVSGGPAPAQSAVLDTLSANMEHGAPEAHRLLFIVQAHEVGAPTDGTPEQMEELATEPAYFRTRHKNKPLKPLPPVPLQKDEFAFNIPVRQFKDEPSLDLEIAAAAYDADGQMMNAIVRIAKKDLEEKPGSSEPVRFFRVEQDLEVPVGAASIRFAVRDTLNDRTGAMEIKLPLAPETSAPTVGR